MPLIWGYYHKWIKWADTFWRLALKSGFHSQMEQFQNALLVPWHTGKVCSTRFWWPGQESTTPHLMCAGTAPTSLPAALGRVKPATLWHNNQMKRCWFWNNKPGGVPGAPKLTLLKSREDEHWADVLAGMCRPGSISLLAPFLLQ